MSSLEIIRQACEDIEVYEGALCAQLEKKPKTTKQQVTQYHHISNLIDRIKDQSEFVSKTAFKDEDGSFKEEIENMKGVNAFGSFYNHLKETREYHTKFNENNKDIKALASTIEEEMSCKVEFSGEEMFGKYLDLHHFHELYLNMKSQFGEEHVDYADYLTQFYKFDTVPRQAKNGKYFNYLKDMVGYLKSFSARTNPLVSLDSLIEKECIEPFEESWSKGEVVGWTEISSNQDNEESTYKELDLSSFKSHESLEALGMSRLAEGLKALGLKSGGGLKERAMRLYSVKGLKKEQYPKNIKAKVVKKKEEEGEEEKKDDKTSNKRKVGGGNKEIAFHEVLIHYLATNELEEVVVATKKHVEKRHTMLPEERAAELAEEASDLVEEGDDEVGDDGDNEDDADGDGPLYNPLNLPLGWDGKPIPYWLYKLHGLGVEFKCEICGNTSYFGRLAFDRHFQEFQHAYGMRCLGIPNTKHFHDITLIEDAVALYGKLKNNMSVELFDAAAEEEYEDSEGHVLNRKTYEDLARQGLL